MTHGPKRCCWVGLLSPSDAQELWRIMTSHTSLFIVFGAEFHPGVPWKGLQNIDPENDPDVTPGSVPTGPTINTTIQDVNRYLLKSGGKHTDCSHICAYFLFPFQKRVDLICYDETYFFACAPNLIMLLLGTVTDYPEIIVLKEGIKKFLLFHGNVNIFMLEKAVRCNLNFCGHWKFL